MRRRACFTAFIFLAGFFMLPPRSLHCGKLEINLWHSYGYQGKTLIEEMAREYNGTHPGVTVKPVFQGLYEEMELKMLAAAVTRRLPEVAQEQFEFMAKYIDEGILEPIDSMVGEEDRKDILPRFWELASKDGKIYGVPFGVSTTVLFYNRDLFVKSGLDPDKPPATWDEMIAQGKRIVSAGMEGGKPQRYAYSFWRNGFYGWAPLLWANGGDLFTEDGSRVVLDTEPMLKTMNMLRDLAFTHGIMPQSWTDWETGQAFLRGMVAMGPFSSAGIRYGEENLPWKLGVAPLPAVGGKSFTAFGGSALLNFAKNQKTRRAVHEFILWMVSKENTVKLHQVIGYIPVRMSALESLALRSFHKASPNYRVPIDQLPHARPLPNHREYFRINSILVEMLDRIFIGGGDPKAELKRAEGEINKLL